MKQRQTQTRQLTPLKKGIFFTITVISPVLVLVLLELALRTFGYGSDMSLFRKETIWGKTYYQMNPDVKYRYFGSSAFQPSTSPAFFQVPKPKGTYRIFVLGESTTAGYPYWFNGSFPAFLQTRLRKIFPEKRIEVINLGMTATNSFTALDIVRELPKYQPDLIIYYGGHNEFYGALGVASNLSVGSYRGLIELYLSLVHLRAFQLVRNIIHSILGLFVKKDDSLSRGTEMEQVARGQLVPYESSLYRETYSIFRKNLEDIRSFCLSRKIPLIIGTQVSNLRDQPPFVSGFSSSTTPSRRAEFTRLLKHGIELQSEWKWDSACADYNSAIDLDSLYAEAHFRLAQCLDTSGHKLEALHQYTLARNFDELRFRTDSNFNNIIRSMSDDRYCLVADVVKAFKAASPDSLIGFNLILEHLHPNSRGAFLIARCYARVMERHGMLASTSGWASADTLSDEELWHDRRVTEIDEYMARLSVNWLTSGWPFKDSQPSLSPVPRSDTLDWISEQAVAGKISWLQAHLQAITFFSRRGDLDETARIYRSLISLSPLDLQLYSNLAQVYIDEHKLRDAVRTMLKSVEIYPTLEAYRSLGDLMMRESNPDSAVAYYGQMYNFAQTPDQMLRNGIAISYALARAGRYSEAKARLHVLLEQDPGFQPAVRLLDDINAIEGTPPVRK